MTREKGEPAPSGWCSAPRGARPKCEDCRSQRCSHNCATHTDSEED